MKSGHEAFDSAIGPLLKRRGDVALEPAGSERDSQIAILVVLFAVVVVMAPVQPPLAIAAAASTCVPQSSGATGDARLDGLQWSVAGPAESLTVRYRR